MPNAPMAEFLGTMLLVLLGDGVVANVVLKRTKGSDSGWIVITAGWAFAVTVGVYASRSISGAHLNPAVTLALAATGAFPSVDVPVYLLAQMCGAVAGAVLVYLAYRPHFAVTDDKSAKLGVFATGPAIRSPIDNLICETIGTFVLMFGLLSIFTEANFAKGSPLESGFSPMLVGLLVWAIGVSLGGPTGYAINPARDLGPRIAHAILPIAGKGGSDWGYAWVPVVGPILGAMIAAFAHQAMS
jgi:glycerol uptake facilitator protein